MRQRPFELLRSAVLVVGAITAALLLTTVLVWILEEYFGVADASPGYLLAVTIVALTLGTGPAAATAVGGALVYNFFFTLPLFTFVVADTGQLLNLVLLLVVGVVVGRLTGSARERARAAELRESEAMTLARVSRTLATRADTRATLTEIAELLRERLGDATTWIALGETPARERPLGGEGSGQLRTAYAVLHRQPGEERPRWTTVRPPSGGPPSPPADADAYRVPIEVAARRFGSLWTARVRGATPPDAVQTRILATTADQIGQALEQDRLRAEAITAELARRSDAVKTALLESVSHELRTPLAAIRASAGTLADGAIEGDEARSVAQSIDDEASRMDRLVGDLLDMSRIEGGALRPAAEPYALDDLLDAVLLRLRPLLAGRTVAVDLPPTLPYVLVDATLVEQVMTNVLENAARHAPRAAMRVSAVTRAPEDAHAALVQLTIEDDGPGVPDEAMPRIFEKFYRVSAHDRGRGTGMGLAVVRGMVEAMGGIVSARHSHLGGLAIDVLLPVAEVPIP